MSELSKIEKPEKLKKKSFTGKNGGARPGAGRPKGRLSKKTLEQKAVEDEIRQRVLKNSKRLLDSQFRLAQGCSYLYCIEYEDENGKGSKKKKKPFLVTDRATIEAYLAGELDDDKFYYITTERPDGRAIDSLLDRTFGKAKQAMELTGKDGDPIQHRLIYRPEKLPDDYFKNQAK